MQKEILQTVNAEDVYGLSKAADPEARQVDQVSKAGSSVSRPVLQANMEQLHELRSQLGLIKKNRPVEMPDVQVNTPMMGADMDRLSTTNVAIDLERDMAQPATAGNKFIAALQKKDRELFDKLVALMHFFNQQEIDMRLVAQLKTCFTSKEQGTIAQVPLENRHRLDFCRFNGTH